MAARSDLEGSEFSEKSGSNISENTARLSKIFERIINSNGSSVKSQQRTEKDLTEQEKLKIVSEIYNENQHVFLMRFGKFLIEEDFDCFSANDEMHYVINKLKKDMLNKACGTDLKNRRYEALLRLEKETDYFSEEKMRERCPFLYEQYIGQFMSDDEKLARDEKQMCGDVKMSSFIFQQMDREWLQDREKLEQEDEEGCIEEEEEEECGGENKATEEVVEINAEEKLYYRQEFLQLMKHNFLAGLDKDFDYSKVDCNEEYDNFDIMNQDAEDNYFDSEEVNHDDKNEDEETMSTGDASSEDDYLSDEIIRKCCTAKC